MPTEKTRAEATAVEALREVTELRLEVRRMEARRWEEKLATDRLLDRLHERLAKLETRGVAPPQPHHFTDEKIAAARMGPFK